QKGLGKQEKELDKEEKENTLSSASEAVVPSQNRKRQREVDNKLEKQFPSSKKRRVDDY
ncbi:10849_t:CDS:1, partial [Cetraspora pellucida]